MRLFSAEYVNEVKLAFDGYHYLCRHKLLRLLLCDSKRNIFDLRLSRNEACAIPRKAFCGHPSERKIDIPAGNHKRKAGGILNVKIYRHLLDETFRQVGWFTAPALYIDPLSHSYLLYGNLPFNRLKSPNGSTHATPTDTYQQSSEQGHNDGNNRVENCEVERPSIPVLLDIAFGLVFGGLLCIFGAGVGLHNKWRCWRTALIGSGIVCVWLSVLFVLMTGLHPYTWGLPPQRLPTQLNPCPQDYRDCFPASEHSSILRQRVSQFPDSIRKVRSHRGRYAQGLMNAAEIVIGEPQASGRPLVPHFFENQFVKRVKRRICIRKIQMRDFSGLPMTGTFRISHDSRRVPGLHATLGHYRKARRGAW